MKNGYRNALICYLLRPEQENEEVTLDGMDTNRIILGLAVQRLLLKTKRKES